jgi:hypothetical protein
MTGLPSLQLFLEAETDCQVCGLGAAFARAKNYDTCARCEWVDDPAAYRNADEKSAANDYSLSDARRTWPRRAADKLEQKPLSILSIVTRANDEHGYDLLVDNTPLREFYPRSLELKAQIGPWENGFSKSTALGVSGLNAAQRLPLYVCQLCGDLDESSLTAEVHIRGNRIIWARVGMEWLDFEADERRLDLLSGPSGFAFDAEQYRNAMAKAELTFARQSLPNKR